MKPITDENDIRRYQSLIKEMTSDEEGRENEIKLEWARSKGWLVVPVEDTLHLSMEEISIIVPALKQAGHRDCLAIATQFVSPAPACLRLAVSVEDFKAFNKSDCGLLRYLLTTDDLSWAISLHEWFNLYAATPPLLAALLGKPIEEARQEFAEFAQKLARGRADEPLLEIARRYASL
jgi:hypothetical protein